MSSERRIEPRVPLRAQAEVRFGSWEMFKLVWTVNVSAGGLLFATDQLLEPGTHLVLKLELPSGPPLELEAVVRHATEIEPPQDATARPRCLCGVEFHNISVSTRAAIRERIKAHTEAAAKDQ